MITTDQEYIDLVKTKGLVFANNEAASSWFDVNPDIIANMTSQYSGGGTIAGASIMGNKTSDYDKFKTNPHDGLKPGENRITGGYGMGEAAAWFGGKSNVGILSGVGSAIGTAAKVGEVALAYSQFEEDKKNNAIKLEEMRKSNLMKQLQTKNRVNQGNRYAMLGMGNSNNQVATNRAVAVTPYTHMTVG